MSDHEVLEEDHTARPPTVQEALARVMGDVRAVGNLERNMRRLHLAEAVILANVFGVSLAWLAGLPTALPKNSGDLVYDVTSCDPGTGEVWHTAVAMRTDHDDTETGHWVASWTSQEDGETEYAAHPAEWFTAWSAEAVA